MLKGSPNHSTAMRLAVRYMVIALLMGIPLAISAQKVKQVEISFSLDRFYFSDSETGRYKIEALDPGFIFPNDPGLPALPMKRIRVLVPPGSELVDFRVKYEEVVVKSGKQLSAVPSVALTRPMEIQDIMDFDSPDHYPESPVQYGQLMIQRGFTWIGFVVSPFSYHAKSKELKLHTNLVLEVEYKVNEESRPELRQFSELEEAILGSVENPDDLERDYPASGISGFKSSSEQIDYLVLTSEALKEGFEPLLEWKARKGLKVDLITMEEIEEAYDGPSTQLKLKQCLKDYYIRHNLRWALLGGDVEVVPVQGCYSKIIMDHTELIDYSILTDLFYACFVTV